MDLYNLKIDGDVAASVTTAVGGRMEVERNCLSATLKIRGGATVTDTARKQERAHWCNGN